MTMLFFYHFSVKIDFFEFKLLQVFLFIKFHCLPRFVISLLKTKSCKEKLFFGHFEIFTILSDIFEHFLIHGTPKLTVPDDATCQIPKLSETAPRGLPNHIRFICMQPPPSLHPHTLPPSR